MPWLQVILDTEAQYVEEISDGLVAIGAICVTLQDAEDQALYEPPLNTTPLWQRTQVVGLFDADEIDSLTMPLQLQNVLAPLPLPSIKFQHLEDQEWTQLSMMDFHPMRFGQRVWICPSWEPPPQPQAVNIFLDPGLAFGTGTHATTALCLEWLDQHRDWSNKVLIDYGCGSGILAITAAKLGAAHVWAVDIDPQALLATKANAETNQVTMLISTLLPTQLPHLKVDGLVANILFAPLIKLAPTLANYLKPAAPLVLSGILKEQTAAVVAAYDIYFTIIEITERDNWMRIVGTKL
jgi:ribosomal protein L11 methyltransferase